MEISIVEIILFCVIGVAAFAQGFTGLGFSIICMTCLSLLPVDLERISVIINIYTLMLTGILAVAGKRKRDIDWRLTGNILSGMIVGVPIGYFFILYFGNNPIFRFCFGLALLLLTANHFYHPAVEWKQTRMWSLAIGAVGGFLNGAFTASGPIIAWYVYSQSQDTQSNKSVLQIFIFSATLWRLANILIFGKGVTTSMMALVAAGLPIVAIATLIGHTASGRVSLKTFLFCVYTLIGASGLINVVRALK